MELGDASSPQFLEAVPPRLPLPPEVHPESTRRGWGEHSGSVTEAEVAAPPDEVWRQTWRRGSRRAAGTVDLTAVGHLLVDGPGVEAWSFEGLVGQVMSVTVRSDTFEPSIPLLSPTGEELARDDDGGPNDRGYDPARAVAFLPTDGRYLVRVATDGRASGGACEVQVHAPTVAPLALNTPAEGRYDDARGPDVWSLDGSAGQIVSIHRASRRFQSRALQRVTARRCGAGSSTASQAGS